MKPAQELRRIQTKRLLDDLQKHRNMPDTRLTTKRRQINDEMMHANNNYITPY